MIRIIVFTLGVFVLTTSFSQSFDWAIGVGGESFDDGRAIVADLNGNIYVCGKFKNQMDFDPSDAEFFLNSGGNSDSYVAKYNSEGNFIWVRHFDGISTSANLVTDMTIDSKGHLILVGEFVDQADFDPLNPGGEYSAVSKDGYVIKMNGDGELVWVEHMAGAGDLEIVAVCVDENDNIYHIGDFWQTQNFNLENGSGYSAPNGRSDIYVQKLDPNGENQWIHHPKGADSESAEDILAQNGSVYLTGGFSETLEFETEDGSVSIQSLDSWDAFVEKLSSDGEHIWASSWGGQSFDRGNKILTDMEGKIQVIGEYLNVCYFTDEVILPKVIGGAGYILTIREDGSWERVRQTGVPHDAVFDNTGHLYLALQNSILKYDLEGKVSDEMRFEKLSGTGSNEINEIVITHNNDLLVTGQYFDMIDFDPGEGEQIFTSNKWSDMFIVKLTSSTTAVSKLSTLQNHIKISPNPFQDQISIQGEIVEGDGSVQLIDQSGRVVYESQINLINNKSISLPASLPHGMYVLRIIHDNQLGIFKLVKS